MPSGSRWVPPAIEVAWTDSAAVPVRRPTRSGGCGRVERCETWLTAPLPPTRLAATLLYARNAVNELLQLFDRSATITESSLDANVILSRDLLYVPDQEIDGAFSPVSTVVTQLIDRLLDTAAHADTMRAAFDARLARGDFIGARLALDFLETEEDVDECMASLTRRIDDLRRTLSVGSTPRRYAIGWARRPSS